MNELRWEAMAVSLASLISLVYVWRPGPYPMGAFTFIAQPLFLVAIVSYGWKAIKELRQRRVL
ncbi:MAG: hypothetical protein WDO74_01860 [Pseudomonadota bacterium]